MWYFESLGKIRKWARNSTDENFLLSFFHIGYAVFVRIFRSVLIIGWHVFLGNEEELNTDSADCFTQMTRISLCNLWNRISVICGKKLKSWNSKISIHKASQKVRIANPKYVMTWTAEKMKSSKRNATWKKRKCRIKKSRKKTNSSIDKNNKALLLFRNGLRVGLSCCNFFPELNGKANS